MNIKRYFDVPSEELLEGQFRKQWHKASLVTNGRPAKRGLYGRRCSVCDSLFYFEALDFLADESIWAPQAEGLDDETLEEGRAYFRSLKRCLAHERPQPSRFFKRGGKLVWALAGHFKDRGYLVVKGRSSKLGTPKEMDWWSLFHRPFSVLDDKRGLNSGQRKYGNRIFRPANGGWEAETTEGHELAEPVENAIGVLTKGHLSLGFRVSGGSEVRLKEVESVASSDDIEPYAIAEEADPEEKDESYRDDRKLYPSLRTTYDSGGAEQADILDLLIRRERMVLIRKLADRRKLSPGVEEVTA